MVNVLLVVMRIWLGRSLERRYVRKQTGGLARKVAKALSEWGNVLLFCKGI